MYVCMYKYSPHTCTYVHMYNIMYVYAQSYTHVHSITHIVKDFRTSVIKV